MADEQRVAPRVWHFVPCDRVERQGAGPYTLVKVRHEIPDPLGHVVTHR